jgi:hypothetical protein
MERISFAGGGLHYQERAIAPGAQTERRGDAGPVRNLLGGLASPAAFLLSVELRAENGHFLTAAPAIYFSGAFCFLLGRGRNHGFNNRSRL